MLRDLQQKHVYSHIHVVGSSKETCVELQSKEEEEEEAHSHFKTSEREAELAAFLCRYRIHFHELPSCTYRSIDSTSSNCNALDIRATGFVS
jgi:ferritin-like protein